MKRMCLAVAVVGAFGFAFAAHADVTPPRYDGSGSLPAPGDSGSLRIAMAGNAYDPRGKADDQAQNDETDAEAVREKAAKRAAGSSSTSDLLDYAAVLDQGNAFHAPDPAQALDDYEKAADLGDEIGRQRMAIAYILGEGRPVDLKKGFEYAAKLGDKDPAGLFCGGIDYERGITGPKDMDMAIAAYSAAAKAGSGEAADALGRITLAQGKPEAARDWFRQGVYLGSADAMDHMAVMAEAGQGGAADKAEAYWLYVNAARRGNAHAQAWVAALPPSTVPLPRATLFRNGKQMGFSRTYGQPLHTQSLDVTALARAFKGIRPTEAMVQRVDVTTTVHCYINAEHQVDACIVEREFPLGYGLGQMLVQIYNGHITTSDVDAAGRSTAGTVFAVTLDWGGR